MLSEKEPSFLERVEEWVEKYITHRATAAIAEVERLKHGKGCQCNNCLTSAVNNANSWVDFIVDDGCVQDEYHYGLGVSNGKLSITDPPIKKKE